MNDDEMVVSWRTLLQMACAEHARQEMEALPTSQQLQELYPDTGKLTRRVMAAIQAQRKGTGRRLRIVKRVAVAAAILASLLFGTLMVNAEIRAAVVNTVIEWTERDIGIRFEVEGVPLSALPEGYGPHYIPEGLIFDEKMSLQETDGSFFYTYASADGKVILDIQVGIAQNGSAYWIDNEHLEHERITFNGVTAYYGHGTSVGGDEISTLLWLKDGIEHDIYTNVSMSELFEIAENIY